MKTGTLEASSIEQACNWISQQVNSIKDAQLKTAITVLGQDLLSLRITKHPIQEKTNKKTPKPHLVTKFQGQREEWG